MSLTNVKTVINHNVITRHDRFNIMNDGGVDIFRLSDILNIYKVCAKLNLFCKRHLNKVHAFSKSHLVDILSYKLLSAPSLLFRRTQNLQSVRQT